MGIHFACHHCNHSMHVKDFQAGKRGKCPSCNQTFRIPIKDASYSSAIDDPSYQPSAELIKAAHKKSTLEAISNLGGSNSEASENAVTAATALVDEIDKTKKPSPSAESSSNAKTVVARKTPVASDAPSETVEKGLSQGTLEMPKSLFDAPETRWFVRPPRGGQFGPATSNLLMDWIRERRVTHDSLLWNEGMAQWEMASAILPDVFARELKAGTGPVVDNVNLSGSFAPAAALSLAPQSTSVSGIVIKKKLQKRRQQWNLVILLGMVSILLLCILIYVLVFQVAKSNA